MSMFESTTRHRARRFGALLLSVLLAAVTAQDADALTVYRLGGAAGVDAPTAADYQVDESSFTYLREGWDSYQEDGFGAVTLVDPGLAFIEPVTLDETENLTPLIDERGGSVRMHDGYAWKEDPNLDLLHDGDETTGFAGDTGATANVALCSQFSEGGGGALTGLLGINDSNCRTIRFDLGGAFFVSHIRFSPTPRRLNSFFLKAFRIGANDGDPFRDGEREMKLRWSFENKTFDWDIWVERLENTEPAVEIQLPPEPVQHLLIEAPLGKWEIAEFEIFGTGAAPFASYVSRIIDLGGPASIGEFTWAGEQSEGVPVSLTVRSGTTPDPNIYWRETFRGSETSRFNAAGEPLTRDSYFDLPVTQRAGITQDKQNWGDWAPVFEFDEWRAALGTTRPQQFVQMKVDFRAQPGRRGSRLDYVQFAATQPPVAKGAIAEITPAAVEAGRLTRFSYRIAPDVRTGTGFDVIAIETPRRPRVETVLINDEEAAWTPIREDDEGLAVGIPRVSVTDPVRSIEVVFEAEVFRFGTEFSGFLSDSERPGEVPQPITPGNADDLIDSNSLSVSLANTGQSAIGSLRLSSPVITPNGDGANDQVLIEFDLINVDALGGSTAALELYTLDGRRVAALSEVPAASGRVPFTWDGTDGAGNFMPPGVYLLRLVVDADSDTAAELRPISVAY